MYHGLSKIKRIFTTVLCIKKHYLIDLRGESQAGPLGLGELYFLDDGVDLSAESLHLFVPHRQTLRSYEEKFGLLIYLLLYQT